MVLNRTRNDIYVGLLAKTRINASFGRVALFKPNSRLIWVGSCRLSRVAGESIFTIFLSLSHACL